MIGFEEPAAPGSLPAGPVADVAPALPAPPELHGAARLASRAGHGFFRLLNRFVAVPLLRAGLGPWLGTPVGGWLLLLRVRGRRTGVIREVPLSYLLADGSAWVMAGFGPATHWYRNLLADPAVEVLLPGRSRRCIAEEVRDPATRRRIVPRLVRATGLPGYLAGVDPFRSPVDRVLAATAWVPLIRLRPADEPIVAGPDDPGGSGWIWRQTLVLVAMVALSRSVGRALGREGALRHWSGRARTRIFRPDPERSSR